MRHSTPSAMQNARPSSSHTPPQRLSANRVCAPRIGRAGPGAVAWRTWQGAIGTRASRCRASSADIADDMREQRDVVVRASCRVRSIRASFRDTHKMYIPRGAAPFRPSSYARCKKHANCDAPHGTASPRIRVRMYQKEKPEAAGASRIDRS